METSRLRLYFDFPSSFLKLPIFPGGSHFQGGHETRHPGALVVKVQKQHKASPTSSHLPQTPFPSSVTVPGKVNTLLPCQKWDFILLPWQFLHLALFSLPPSLFFFSSIFPSLPLLPHLDPSSSFIYVVCVVVFFQRLFKSPLPCLVGSFSPSDEVCNYISP